MQANQKPDNVVDLNFKLFSESIPPQNVEAEEAILGGILLDPGAMDRVVDLLVPAKEVFYIQQHGLIYAEMCALHAANLPVDLMSVATYLYDQGLLERLGGQAKLAQLVDCTVSAVNIDRYADLVLAKYKHRQLIKVGNEIVKLGYDTTQQYLEVADQSEQLLFGLAAKDQNQIESADDILVRIYDNLTSPKKKGILSGLFLLDRLLGGFKRKYYYIVAGRTSMGKTQFAVYLAAVFLKKKLPVVFFSAEMDRDRLMTRILASESGVDSKKIQESRVSTSEDLAAIQSAVASLGGCPLYLDDTPGSMLTPIRIRAAIRRASSLYGKVGLVVLDYLQLMGDESASTNRTLELGKISKAIKAIAHEFDVPFVALAQINRGVEQRQNKRPMVSDLRESGSLEMDADGILMLYRDDYYNPDDTKEPGTCEIILAKNRDGRCGTVLTNFKPEISHFGNLGLSGQEAEEEEVFDSF